MSLAGTIASELNAKAGKPAYLKFKTVAKHLPVRSQQEGRYVAKDVDMVEVRQIGSSDCAIFEVETWLKQNYVDVQQGRLPEQFAEFYKESYRRWKAGQEMPVEGTPIRSWPVISPAQVETVLQVGVRTVEDLADLNDEGLKKIGMGAVDLKNKAKAWMQAAHDKGKISQEMAAVQKENSTLKDSVAKLTEQVEELRKLVKVQSALAKPEHPEPITSSELIEDEPAPRGRKR